MLTLLQNPSFYLTIQKLFYHRKRDFTIETYTRSFSAKRIRGVSPPVPYGAGIEKAGTPNTGIPACAETEGFEPSCRLPGKLISSQPRYDHFDTSPDEA